MIRPLIAIALLSVSWLAGLGYFHLADPWMWSAFVCAGMLLMIGTGMPLNFDRKSWLLAVFALPTMLVMPWPYIAIPLMLIIGALLQQLPIERRWPANLGTAMVFSALVLAIQSVAIFGYAQFTARSHELPAFVGEAIATLARLAGIDAAYSGVNIGLSSMRRNHLLGATWELLLDPASLAFIIGTIVWLRLQGYCTRKIGIFVLSALIWVPLRVAIIMGLIVNSGLRTDFDATLSVTWPLTSAWLAACFLVGAAVVCGLLLRSKRDAQVRPVAVAPVASALACIGVLIITFGIYFDSAGSRAQGRVMVDESHSQWERTDKPYDTNWYGHDAGYNYAVLFDYLSRFYNISRINEKLDDAALANCDVLIIKTPTVRYTDDEIVRILTFVERGGGLMLVGEHTDVFGTGTSLNDIARKLGFEFRYDCLFGVDKPFEQKNEPALVSHPAVQYVKDHQWAVSCSIDPGFSSGRGVVVSTGLRNLLADYHASNYYPQPEDRAEARFGAFVQIWSARHGSGRVIAFTDSTQFSNFCLFDPGKSELFVNMLEWCNHRGGAVPQWIFLLIGGLLVVVSMGISWVRKSEIHTIVAGLLGFSLALPMVSMIHRKSLPFPDPQRPLTRIAMDRTVCDAPLPLAGFISGQPTGFGIFERWILRLGYFTTRASDAEALKSNLIVFANPNLSVPRSYRDSLEQYVRDGGHILVVDSPENARSTANSVLWPFGVTMRHDNAPVNGAAAAPPGWPGVGVNSAVTMQGEKLEPLMKIGDQAIAGEVKFGKGSVVAIGFGSSFTDNNYGYTGDSEPDPAMRQMYEIQFKLLRRMIEGESPATQPTTQPTTAQ